MAVHVWVVPLLLLVTASHSAHRVFKKPRPLHHHSLHCFEDCEARWTSHCFCVDTPACNEWGYIVPELDQRPRSNKTTSFCPENEWCCQINPELPWEKMPKNDPDVVGIKKCCHTQAMNCPQDTKNFPWMILIKTGKKVKTIHAAVLIDADTAVIPGDWKLVKNSGKYVWTIIQTGGAGRTYKMKGTRATARKNFTYVTLDNKEKRPTGVGYGPEGGEHRCCMFVEMTSLENLTLHYIHKLSFNRGNWQDVREGQMTKDGYYPMVCLHQYTQPVFVGFAQFRKGAVAYHDLTSLIEP